MSTVSGGLFSSFGIRARLITILVVSLLIVFGIAGTIVIARTSAQSREQATKSAESLAYMVAEGMIVFPQSGDMDGFKLFMQNIKERGNISEVRAVRAPVTVMDYGERAGSDVPDATEEDVITSSQPKVIENNAEHYVRYVLPLHAKEQCMGCHSAAKPDQALGVASVTVSTADAAKAMANTKMWVSGVFVAAAIVEVALFSWVLSAMVIKTLSRVMDGLGSSAKYIQSASGQVAQVSQQVAQGASSQASSIEQTSASLKEIASMTARNSENADKTKGLTAIANRSIEQGAAAFADMANAMERIKTASDETTKIVKSIDEIAFQTNLLALNAAVEAARAGDAGKGFTVVAEEVRNLAGRAAGAARHTAELIEGSKEQADSAVEMVDSIKEMFTNIQEVSANISDLVSKIAAASKEQSHGVQHLNVAVSQMDKVVQQNAANSEESASSAQELSAQSEELGALVESLIAMVLGGKRQPRECIDASAKTRSHLAICD